MPSPPPTSPERLVKLPNSNENQPQKARFLYEIELGGYGDWFNHSQPANQGRDDSALTTIPRLGFAPRSDVLFVPAKDLQNFAQIVRTQRSLGSVEHATHIALEPSLNGIPIWEIMGAWWVAILEGLKALRTISIIFPVGTGPLELDKVAPITYPFEKFPRVRPISDLELSSLQIKADFTQEVWDGMWHRFEWTKSALEFFCCLKQDIERNSRVESDIDGLNSNVRDLEVVGRAFLGLTLTSE
ncbi:hypothetical protein E8E14_007825 [Neopestalotiopsis sp. 37M]|nr:hypothetical protein E8E14_007825 [Neopestalotiopsis sp. 37M]